CDEELEAGGDHAADGAGEVEEDAELEWADAAVDVEGGADDELADGEAGEIDGERELDEGGMDAQIARDGRERREVHVDGEGAECRQDTEEVFDPDGALGGFGGAVRGHRGA